MVISMQGEIKFEKNVSAGELVAEANTIWKKVKAAKGMDRDALYNKIREEHGHFLGTYIIVINYMINHDMYHPTAMTRYVSFIKNNINSWNSGNIDDYAKIQAKYAYIVNKVLNKNATERELLAIMDQVAYAIRQEYQEMKNREVEARRIVEAKEKQREQLNKDDVVNELLKLAAAAPADVRADATTTPADVPTD